MINDSQTPPSASADWQPFTLPLATRLPEPASSNLVYWFRTSLERPAGSALQGVYLYRYNKSVDLYFNGDYVGGDTHKPGWNTAAWNHPTLLAIQSANWRSGSNELHIRLQTSRMGGVFAGMLAGDYAALQPLYEQRYFRQVTLNEWLLSFGVLVTLLSLLLWALRRQESLYWQFALVSTCWMLITWHMVAYYQPLSDRWWLPVVHMGIDGWIFSLSLFMASWFGLQRLRQLRLQAALFVIGCAWHALMWLPYWWLSAYLLHSIGIVFVLLLQYAGIRRSLQERGQLSVLALIVFIQVLCYFHDLYELVLVQAPDWLGSYHWTPLAFPLMQGIFLVGLIRRFIGALNVAEGANQMLEVRVTEARQQLETAYAQAREAEMLKAADQERSRIYRDLHDDVGSKLLSIAHAGRDTRLGGLASAALESLREAVARVNNPETSFGDFLQALQEEMTLRLGSLGVTLQWSQPEQGLEWMLDSGQHHHLSRIFRELVSNVIRHSGATEVAFAVRQVGDSWQFTLADNGGGMAPGQPAGNGLQNLRTRTAELGAHIQWNNRPQGGVLVSLALAEAPSTTGIAAP
ncbi:MAG: ATP-binding protein [Pseudomonadota bacterium]